MGYCDYTDAWVFALTRQRRQELADHRAQHPPTIRFSVGVDGVIPQPPQRRKCAMKNWAKRVWKAGVTRCYWCADVMNGNIGQPHKRTVDHLIPLVHGGRDDESNWVLACYRCNHEKADMLPDEFERYLSMKAAAAWARLTGSDPASTNCATSSTRKPARRSSPPATYLHATPNGW